MKRASCLIVCAVAVLSTLHSAPRASESERNADASGVIINPSQGEIAPGDELTITFPDEMVSADKIDMEKQPCPFVSRPPIEGDFLWKSQTEGVFVVKSVIAGAKHQLTLARGLRDLDGQAVTPANWSAEFTAREFTVASGFDWHDDLSAQPQVELDFTYDVRLTEVAEHVYFQDRDSRQRLPVDVILWGSEKLPIETEAKSIRVAPRQPLPMARAYDVIVNGLVDAKSHRPLRYLKVIPAGKTSPLRIEWVGTFNHALEEASIRIKFSDEIDPSEATPEKISVDPPIKEMKLLASGDEIQITGNFDLAQRYKVTISTALKGERGYGLAQESRWGATFHRKEPCIVFPASQIFLRARQDIRFTFFQVNTSAVTWKLARIPLEKLPAVSARVRDFEKDALDPVTRKPMVDPRTGFNKQFQTELLIDAFSLPVVSSGTIEAAPPDIDTKRDIRCALPSGETGGAYLLEASAPLDGGRVVGNRSIICATDFILTQKHTPAGVIVRVTKMSDALPVSGVTVRAVTNENIELSRGVTDKNGIATFSRDKVFPEKKPGAHLFIADTKTGPALLFANGTSYSTSGYADASQLRKTTHAEIITDRNLYRPGQEVKMKGMMRQIGEAGLLMPTGSEVQWTVAQAGDDRIVGEGVATLSAYGGWEAAWTIPEKSKLGRFEIRGKIDNQQYDGATAFSVEEYRVPLFSVVVEAAPEVGAIAHAKVSSAYFHGAPNNGARVHWKATWTAVADYDGASETSKQRYNTYAELGPHLDLYNEATKTIEGDAQLDRHGFAMLACESPFKDDAAVTKAGVFWRVEVTSVDGQTIVGGETAQLFPNPVRLGVRATEQFTEPRGIGVRVDAIDPKNDDVVGVAVRIDLFHVTTKVAKEQIAPFVYRYRNADQFAKVLSQQAKTPEELNFPATETGRYVVAVSATDRKAALVSDEVIVTGQQAAELPVQNETGFQITHDTRPFTPGEKAVLTIEAPFAGIAWVSVETDAILDTFLAPISGNAGHIELPIKKEYAPNATVAIYLVKPGGEKELPQERFAVSQIDVRRPERELKIEPKLAEQSVKPGEIVRGEVRVTSENKPVADVDLAVFAVDDAVLQLGEWKLPDVLAGFYQRNPFAVRSYQSLQNYIEEIKLPMLTQKGFIIGGGGEESVAPVKIVRKEFKALAFWQGSLKTGGDGRAKFEFVAPDNLTTYRVVAVGQTRANQFGGDASAMVKISKPLLINPALPRFLRNGDEIELRASVQQNFADTQEVTARCVTDGHCKLIATDTASQTIARDAPTVFRFKARVDDVDLAPVKIRFEVVAKSDSKMADAVELTLPVRPPTIVRKESVAGSFDGPRFDARAKMPADWKRGHGKFDATISTLPWLPKIAGIPVILDYPHGCFDQISTKLLGYSLLANLLAYLPDVQAREPEYRRILERGMKQFNDSLLADGMLPYWPGSETANPFVTCEAFWAVNESAAAGFEVPDGLREKLAGAMKKIIHGEAGAGSFAKCFALFVLTQYETEDDFSTVAQDLYLRRNKYGDEERALLALVLHRLNIMPREKEQLLKEIDVPPKERAFDPATLSSMTRAEAMRALAFEFVPTPGWSPKTRQQTRERMLALMDSSVALSTQENLWLLLAFKAMVGAEGAPPLPPPTPPGVLSKNGCSAGWIDRKIEPPSQGSGASGNQLLIDGLNKAALTFLMKAEYSTDDLDTNRVDRGFRVERVVKNLTDAKRTGDINAPFKLGDQILITYRMNTRKKQNYVALEDSLPGGLEVVNPNIAMIAKFFELPATGGDAHLLALSYSEMRDTATLLYFDEFAPGTGVYSVVARATAAGTFRWPATQAVPMYDSRFSGLSPSSLCVISGD